MEKIRKYNINSFKCVNPIVYHWGAQFEIGEECIVIDSGKKIQKIIFDLSVYLRKCPSMPESLHKHLGTPREREVRREWEIFRIEKDKVKDEYSIEIEYNWLLLKGQDKGKEFEFIFESEDEIKDKYNIDSDCKLHFNTSVMFFSDYFDKIKLNREISIQDLLY